MKKLDTVRSRGEIEEDARRYRYIRDKFEWRRSTNNFPLTDDHAFIGCRFPVDMNFSCAAMLDWNIDKMMDTDEC